MKIGILFMLLFFLMYAKRSLGQAKLIINAALAERKIGKTYITKNANDTS